MRYQGYSIRSRIVYDRSWWYGVALFVVVGRIQVYLALCQTLICNLLDSRGCLSGKHQVGPFGGGRQPDQSFVQLVGQAQLQHGIQRVEHHGFGLYGGTLQFRMGRQPVVESSWGS